MFKLNLYITGKNQNSQSDINHLKKVLNKKLGKKYELKIIDILSNPSIAEKKKILATPLLEKISPEPKRRIIGDFSDEEKIIIGLDLDTIGERNGWSK